MYEVYMTQGQGDCGPVLYPSLESALASIKLSERQGSFKIKYPNGEWHKW